MEASLKVKVVELFRLKSFTGISGNESCLAGIRVEDSLYQTALWQGARKPLLNTLKMMKEKNSRGN